MNEWTEKMESVPTNLEDIIAQRNFRTFGCFLLLFWGALSVEETLLLYT